MTRRLDEVYERFKNELLEKQLESGEVDEIDSNEQLENDYIGKWETLEEMVLDEFSEKDGDDPESEADEALARARTWYEDWKKEVIGME